MAKSIRGLVLTTILLFLAQTALFGATYSFDFFQVCPGCSTNSGGINNAGLAGATDNTNFPQTTGYVYNGSTATPVTYPGAFATVVTVPHNNGRVPGAYLDSSTFEFYPFIRETDGTITPYAGYPGSGFTWFLELNAAGDAVGYYANSPADFTGVRGFYRTAAGTYTSLAYPGAAPDDATVLLGLNEAGLLVGYSGDITTGTFTGLIRRPDGSWETLAYPGANSTLLFAINNPGTIAGGYRTASGWHPFTYSEGVFETPSIPGYPNGVVTGINDAGVLLGNTIAPGPNLFGGPQTGFIASPVPEPGTVAAGVAALALLCFRYRAGARNART